MCVVQLTSKWVFITLCLLIYAEDGNCLLKLSNPGEKSYYVMMNLNVLSSITVTQDLSFPSTCTGF